MMTKQMIESSATVLIVAKPGPLREGVQALLGAMPQVRMIHAIDDVSLVLAGEIDGCPDLVLLACGAGEGVVEPAVEQVKARWPQSRYVTLVGSVEQQREAESAGVDVVVLNGLLAQKLVKAIAGALSQ
jgi:DNA-binding NarL/FixJ family response regulator